MIQITLQTNASTKMLQQKLQSTPDESRKILTQALNATANKSLGFLGQFAQQKYDVQGSAFKKGKGKFADVKVKNATKRRLESAVMFSGKKLSLLKFKTNPTGPADPKNVPDSIRGHVLKASGLKPIYKKGNKAFIAQFSSGHIDIVARITSRRLPIKTIYSPAIPQLVGSKRVIPNVNPKVQKQLDAEITKRVDKFLRKKDKKE